MFVPGKPFQPSVMSVGWPGAYSRAEHPMKNNTRLERLANGEYLSLLRAFVNYDRKKLSDIMPRCKFHKTFFSVIYTPSGITRINT